jgi:6-phosphogluconolactonase/glucosamine-6-phosphate isomerase/deaminase
MQLLKYDSEREVQLHCAEGIAQVIREAECQPVLVLYSGGSGLRVMPYLYEYLADLELQDVIFAPLDERLDIRYSNAKAFLDMDVARLFMERAVTFVDVGEIVGGVNAVADQYDEQIRVLLDDIKEHEGVIVSLLGMGPDGHTAGIFPYPEDPTYFNNTFVHTSRMVVGYDVGNKNQYRERITLTIPALKKADYSFVYVVGAEKEALLKRALSTGELAEVPARVWKDLSEVKIFTNCVVE